MSPIPATILGPVSAVYKFVVREVDVEKPTLPADATASNADSNAIINSKQQVAITEANQYVITFPNGLNTQRYAYTEELDLIAYTFGSSTHCLRRSHSAHLQSHERKRC